MGIFRRKPKVTPSAEQESPTFGLVRPNHYNNQYGDLVLPDHRNVTLPVNSMTLDVDHPSRQAVIVHTSATDRAKGFQWMITPISIVLAVLALIVALYFDTELFSLAALLTFWSSFCLVYVIGWGLTALLSAEFVSLFSAWQQWIVIGREQIERWAHLRGEPRPAPIWWMEFKPLIYLVALCSLFVGFVLAVLVVAVLVGW